MKPVRIILVALFLMALLMPLAVLQMRSFHLLYHKASIATYLTSENHEGKHLLELTFEEGSDEIHWHKLNKEFSYQGMMYDIVRSTRNGTKWTYICYIDDRESEIMKKVSEMFRGYSHRDAPLPPVNISLVQTFLLKYITNIQFPSINPFYILSIQGDKYHFAVLPWEIPPETPPPDII